MTQTNRQPGKMQMHLDSSVAVEAFMVKVEAIAAGGVLHIDGARRGLLCHLQSSRLGGLPLALPLRLPLALLS